MPQDRISCTRPAGRKLALTAFGLSFAFFCLVMWCAPYSSDDLEFATLPYTTFREYLTYVLEYETAECWAISVPLPCPRSGCCVCW